MSKYSPTYQKKIFNLLSIINYFNVQSTNKRNNGNRVGNHECCGLAPKTSREHQR